MNTLLILSTVAVLIQPCSERDAVIRQFGGTPFGSCTILYNDAELPRLLARSYDTTMVKPKVSHSWFEAVDMQMDEVQNVLGYTGQGMNVGLMDGGGANASHQELAGHVQNLDAGGTEAHATATTGIIVGQGKTNTKYLGMAPGAFSYNRDYNGDFIHEKETDFDAYSIAADNNSWGYILGWTWGGSTPEFWCFDTQEYVANGFADYDFTSTEVDNLIMMMGSPPRKNVIVFSSGNDRNEYYNPTLYGGHHHCYCPDSTSRCDSIAHVDDHDPDPDYGSVGNVGCAKNAIVVGATYKDDRTGKWRLAGFSSSGPCENGVMKPDFMAPGRDISTIGYSGPQDGTSFSAPYITGIAAVMSQKWNELRGENAGVEIVRGFLAQTAIDMENPGPDYHFGWGLPQVKDAMELMDLTDHYAVGVIDSDQDQTYTITKGDSDPLRCTLSWVEYGGYYLSTDLDLWIEGSGSTFMPYLLDPDNPSLPATTGADHENTTEMVEACSEPPCTSSDPGTYTVHVFANWPILTDGGHPYLLVCSHAMGTGSGEDCNGAGEPNGSPGTAYYILYSGTFSTDICPSGDVDYYTFDHFADGKLTVQMSGGSLDVVLSALDGTTIASGTSIQVNNLARGSYNLRVASSGGGTVNYTMTLTKQDYGHRRPASR